MSVYSLFGHGASSQEPWASVSLEQAAKFILERAKQLVGRLVEDRGHDKPPFSPGEYARLQDIKVVNEDLNETSAVLLRFQDGYVIKVNQTHNMARQNFSCAHEIGHTLFSELKLDNYIPNIEYRTFNPQAHAFARQRVRERLCDAAATELLMPESVFKRYLLDYGVSINSIERLADIFRVSIHTACWRVAEVSPEPCIAAFWKHHPISKYRSLRLDWCVGPGIQLLGGAHYTPVQTTVRYPSMLHKAYEYDNPVKCYRRFKRGTDVRRLPTEAKGFGRQETRYVASLAFLDR
jgi:Zn-dependent peptidase ImmA (M78 family)